MGESLLKLASVVAFQKRLPDVLAYFKDTQFGVGDKGGAEKVVHRVREDYLNGRCILTIDKRNAFNYPSRVDIQKSLLEKDDFSILFGLFDLEYSVGSRLFYYHNGKLFGTVDSKAGVRQGSVLSPFYFCLVLHPILKRLEKAFPDLNVYAYMDDVTFTHHDPAVLEEVFFRYETE